MDIGTLVLLIPIGASIGVGIMSHDYLLFIPAGVLVGLAIWWERGSRRHFTRRNEVG